VPGQFGKRARVDTAEPELMQKFGESQFADAFARIECHYFINKGFFESEEMLLNVDRIRHLRAVFKGRYDVVCPMISAWELHRLARKPGVCP